MNHGSRVVKEAHQTGSEDGLLSALGAILGT